MKTKSFGFTLMLIFSSFVIFLTNGCHGIYLDESKASSTVSQKRLRIGLHKNRPGRSLEETLIKSFLNDYNIHATIVPYVSAKQVAQDFKNQKIDLAVIKTSSRHSKLAALQSPSYEDLQLSLYCRNQSVSEILVPSQLGFIKNELLNKSSEFEDKIMIVDGTFEHILNQSFQKKNSCFIAESQYHHLASLLQKKYFRVWSSEKLYPMAWFIQSAQPELNHLVHIWFQKLIRENKMIRFKDQFDAPAFKMSVLAYKNFKKDILELLPQWKPLFIEYAKKYQVPWTLIAAVAYQESKWNNSAVSYTGVKGVMQITSKTAEHLGIDREDPVQSIQGGTYYLKYLFDKTPGKLTKFERWVQALAAYNMGWAHIRDLHRLAKETSVDAYRWKNLKNLLPEKSNPENAELFQFGLARGEETVDFIEGVLTYHEALNNMFTQQSQTSRDF